MDIAICRFCNVSWIFVAIILCFWRFFVHPSRIMWGRGGGGGGVWGRSKGAVKVHSDISTGETATADVVFNSIGRHGIGSCISGGISCSLVFAVSSGIILYLFISFCRQCKLYLFISFCGQCKLYLFISFCRQCKLYLFISFCRQCKLYLFILFYTYYMPTPADCQACCSSHVLHLYMSPLSGKSSPIAEATAF